MPLIPQHFNPKSESWYCHWVQQWLFAQSTEHLAHSLWWKKKEVCRAWLTNSRCSYVAFCHMHEWSELSWKILGIIWSSGNVDRRAGKGVLLLIVNDTVLGSDEGWKVFLFVISRWQCAREFIYRGCLQWIFHVRQTQVQDVLSLLPAFVSTPV